MKKYLWAGILLIIFSFYAQADELVYTPVNPAFGGQALNGNWLLANAQAQNDHDDPDLERAQKSPLELFRETLQRLLLRDLATSITDYITGDVDELPLSEEIDVGDFTVRIEDLGDGTLEIIATDADGTVTIFTTSSDL